ncbi:MAG: MATE family efflux transporter [Bacillota bacterium]|nr:MATE family efflux transporter [Bacillota bacterium]
MELGTKKISKLLWQLSIPAILGMLSSAIFNIVDRIFVAKINSNALTAVGITMPVQIIQMAFILLIGIGTSALISIKLGEGKNDEAEDILFIALKYIVIFLLVFAILFMVFLNPILSLFSISEDVMPYAKDYIVIIILGSVIGIPGYCLNNSLRSIGKSKVSMKIIIVTSVMNIILDPIFIFLFKMGIAGAAIATVISQTTLTVYVIYAFIKREDFAINLKFRRVKDEWILLKESLRIGLHSFYVQILAAAVNLFLNNSLLKYGTDLDVAALTIMSSIFSFYHMVVVGLVQGNNAICGYNWGAKLYGRVLKSLKLALFFSFLLSLFLFLLVVLFPQLLVTIFTDDQMLIRQTASGIRYYLFMLPIMGPQAVSSQYFQVVGKSKLSSFLAFFRYGIIIIPSIIILAPKIGVKGIYISNAISDGIAGLIAVIYIMAEIVRLKRMEAA